MAKVSNNVVSSNPCESKAQTSDCTKRCVSALESH